MFIIINNNVHIKGKRIVAKKSRKSNLLPYNLSLYSMPKARQTTNPTEMAKLKNIPSNHINIKLMCKATAVNITQIR